MQGWAPSRELLAEVQANPSGSAVWELRFFVDLVKDGEIWALTVTSSWQQKVSINIH